MILHPVSTLVPDPSVLKLPVDVCGWHSGKPEFTEIVRSAGSPNTVIEVGVFVGESTLKLADLCPEARIFAIDHFLLSYEHMGRKDMPFELGYPLLFRQFLKNIVASPHAGRIYPLPQTSVTAARLLKKIPLTADLIYIDGDHSVEAVYADVSAYYELLNPGGVIFGDDYGGEHKGVECDVLRFSLVKGVPFEAKNGFWSIRKPL